MKVREYIAVIEEIDGKMLRIKGQFLVPNKKGFSKDKNLMSGIAMHDAKAGDTVMVRI